MYACVCACMFIFCVSASLILLLFWAHITAFFAVIPAWNSEITFPMIRSFRRVSLLHQCYQSLKTLLQQHLHHQRRKRYLVTSNFTFSWSVTLCLSLFFCILIWWSSGSICKHCSKEAKLGPSKGRAEEAW